MSSFVLDASTLLALLNKEEGWEIVESHLSHSVISAINLSEVAAVLNNIGMPSHEVKTLLSPLIRTVVPFEIEQAYLCSNLRSQTKTYGLSLGDRACLALAQLKAYPVLTADKIWANLDIGVDIRLIRSHH